MFLCIPQNNFFHDLPLDSIFFQINDKKWIPSAKNPILESKSILFNKIIKVKFFHWRAVQRDARGDKKQIILYIWPKHSKNHFQFPVFVSLVRKKRIKLDLRVIFFNLIPIYQNHLIIDIDTGSGYVCWRKFLLQQRSVVKYLKLIQLSLKLNQLTCIYPVTLHRYVRSWSWWVLEQFLDRVTLSPHENRNFRISVCQKSIQLTEIKGFISFKMSTRLSVDTKYQSVCKLKSKLGLLLLIIISLHRLCIVILWLSTRAFMQFSKL